MPNFLKMDFGKKNKSSHIKTDENCSVNDNYSNNKSNKPENPQNIVSLPDTNAIHHILISCIVPNPNQPRDDFDERLLYGLAQSIKDYGIIQPLSVRKLSSVVEDSPAAYELIAGERRLRAAKLLSLETVPCIIVEADKKISAEIAIIENLQREDLNFFEQAKAVEKLIEMFSYSQEQAARRLSVSQSYVANKLRILKLTNEERSIIIENGLTERHARAFIRIADTEERKKVIYTVINSVLNVSLTEKYIDKILHSAKGESSSARIRNEKTARESKRTIILKDIKLFLNSVDKAVNMVAQSGVDIKSEKIDKGEYIEMILTIPKNK